VGKIRVVLSGIYYPVAILRYFQSALLRRSDVELFTVGPYTGRSIPWAGGLLVDCPLPPPMLQQPMGQSVPITYVEALLPWQPDVWIQVDAGYHFLGKPVNGVNLIVGTDPHCLDYDYDRSVADLFFCMQTPYMKERDVWLPYAYDPRFHFPQSDEKLFDFGIVGADHRQGSLYENRTKLAKQLRAKGYNVLQSFGLVYDEYRKAVTSCKVGLNWSTRQDTTARVFETIGMGVTLLTNETPDIQHCFESDQYVSFTTMEEALGCADKLMENDNWRKFQQVPPVRHTWDVRVEYMINQGLMRP
jgi:hypothetical protein